MNAAGYMFVCNKKTEKGCLGNLIFGLPAGRLPEMRRSIGKDFLPLISHSQCDFGSYLKPNLPPEGSLWLQFFARGQNY